MPAIAAESQSVRSERWLRTGAGLMSIDALAFVVYAVIFFVLNLTDNLPGE